MGFLPTFSAWQFALAGLACATAPIIIHLLNRRRYRVVQWAAMPFLREALQRNRKMMQLRDLLVLLLRTAAVLFFGIALARPFFSVGAEDFDRSKPLHAVLVVDNSLSMGYTQIEGTLLDKAKDRAKSFVDELPEGSMVSLIPLCGSEAAVSTTPYTFKDKALVAAIDALEVVDRSASLQRAVNEAKKAMEAAPELSKRIIFFSDQQALNWRDLLNAEQFKELPSMQVVDVAPPEWENTWIA
ncbi:MAG TPA: BatA domain-containing protein, partial [Pirellulaceae bacterium]|nr:BatA domain-containing protein [Pirellulaceae bacterium]